MKSSKTVCGLLDLYGFFGKKWAFALFTNISETPVTFNQLYSLSKHLINPTLLSKRLQEMKHLNLITHTTHDTKKAYIITPEGTELKILLHGIKKWSLKSNYTIPKQCRDCECVCSEVFR